MEKGLYDKLLAVQKDLECPKNQFNKFGNYRYRSCEDILEALKPLLKREGLLLTLSDQVEDIGGKNYIKATATVKSGEESLMVTAFAREADDRKGMDVSQITGASSSYARKYALNGLFCIDDTKDADSHDNSRVEAERKNDANTSEPKIKRPDGSKPDKYKFLAKMREIKETLNALTGSDDVYYRELGSRGYEKSNEIPLSKMDDTYVYFKALVEEREWNRHGGLCEG